MARNTSAVALRRATAPAVSPSKRNAGSLAAPTAERLASDGQGWDKLREETFACQKKLGVIPADCELTKRPEDLPPWDKMEARLHPVFACEMEIYAAFLEYADYHVGHVIDSLSELGILDDTLIYYIIGDNGASAEGSLIGAWNDKAGAEAPDLATPELEHQLGADRHRRRGPGGRPHHRRRGKVSIAMARQ